MTIERLRFPGGEPLWGNTDPSRLADRLLTERVDQIEVLEPGEYDTTPTIGPARGKKTDQLLVLDDGSGVYRSRTVDNCVTSLHNWTETGSHSTKSPGQGMVIHLPSDLKRILVISEHHERRHRGVPYLVEVLRWRDNVSALGYAALNEYS